MAAHHFGMDHALYPYLPFPKRPRLQWPDNARIALCLFLYFEHMDFNAANDAVRDPRWKDRFERDFRIYSWYEYGNRVGIFRILDLLDRYGLKVTVAANAQACERCPYLVESFRKRGYEIAAHGIAANAMISSRMSEAEERAALEEAISRVTVATGARPTGWIGQDYGESPRTPQLLADMGMTYLADWPNDDQPYRMSVGADFVSIPNQVEWDDMKLLWDRRLQMPRYPQIVGDAFDRLYEEGAETGRFFGLNIHPWLLGSAHRIGYIEKVIEAIAAKSGIWQTTAGEVARFTLGHGRS